MWDSALLALAEETLQRARQRHLPIVTAESCTGGLIAALFTEIPGASDVFDRGMVTYTNTAKHMLLGVPKGLFEAVGAVSEAVARAMAQGAITHTPDAGISIAVTGIAGPSGGTKEKPVGLVHMASTIRHGFTLHEKYMFVGDRQSIRLQAVRKALELMQKQL